ncbi:MAG: hypothetical protein AB1938_29235 [Myxococcota bacterium]
MTADRERRARLEAAQQRVARARAALEGAPDVEADLAPLRAEVARLLVELRALGPRADSQLASVDAGRAALRRAKAERWGGVGLRAALVFGSLGAAAVGAVLGGLALYLFAVLGWPGLPVGASVCGAGGLVFLGWRLGRAS